MNLSKKITIATIIIIAAGLIGGVVWQQKKSTDQSSSTSIPVDNAINRAMNFLYKSQLEYGEFETYACKSKNMTTCHFDSSPFVTTFVLYSTKNIHTSKAAVIQNKAISFLLSEEESGGIWRFTTSRASRKIKPDLDDTSTVSYALKSNNVDFGDNTNIINNNRDGQGRFFTWLDKKPANNNIDCVVNTNVLLYLGNGYPKVCNYINSAIKKDKNCSTFYPDKLALYYMVSRAAVNNVSCLNKNREIIINKVLSRKSENGSFGNTLQTALAINTLINYEYHGKKIDKAIDYLIKKQNENGSWPRETFFLGANSYYGSEELTTALCIEALNKYRSQDQD